MHKLIVCFFIVLILFVHKASEGSELLRDRIIVYFNPHVGQSFYYKAVESYGISLDFIIDECSLQMYPCRIPWESKPFSIVKVPTGYVEDWIKILQTEEMIFETKAITSFDIISRIQPVSIQAKILLEPNNHTKKITTVKDSEIVKKKITKYIEVYYQNKASVRNYAIGKHFTKFLIEGLMGEITGDSEKTETLYLSVVVVCDKVETNIYLSIEGHYKSVRKTSITGKGVVEKYHNFEYNSILYKKLHEHLLILSTDLRTYLGSS